MLDLEHARSLLDGLGLDAACQVLDTRMDEASKDGSTYLSFLNSLLETEARERTRRGTETRLKLARLPHRKTLDDFDFSFQPGIDERQIRELASLAFIHRQENVVFLGPPGVGKSHLAVGLAMEAIRQGMPVYFVTMSRLLSDLQRAQLEGRLERRWRIYLRPRLLVVDEVGYMQLDRPGANLFFQLVCNRYEQGSVILTSNKGLGEWGELMGDVAMATAILDRLLHHAHVVNIRGNSYRLKNRMKAGGFPAMIFTEDFEKPERKE